MTPAIISIRESAPNPIRAMDPATMPAATAIPASIPCQARPPQASTFARRTSAARSFWADAYGRRWAWDSTRRL